MKYSQNSGKGEVRFFSQSFWKTVFVLVFMTLIIGTPLAWDFVVNWLEDSSWGKLQVIEITGLERFPETDVLEVARLELGSSLMSLPIDSIAQRVMAMPAVKYARVLRSLPGRLKIQVQERNPIAVLGNGEIRLVDSDGITFPIVGAGEVIDLPVISFSSLKENRLLRSTLFKEAIRLADKITREFPVVHSHLSELVVGEDDVKMKLRNRGAGIRTKREITETNLRTLETFLKQQVCDLPEDLNYIDLSFDDMVVMGAG